MQGLLIVLRVSRVGLACIQGEVGGAGVGILWLNYPNHCYLRAKSCTAAAPPSPAPLGAQLSWMSISAHVPLTWPQ
ncbi:MAG: hypothetical protein DRI90_17695 [Deltaproteobacteria bacterium]|nr:MAG: hypothetical protein DRI90_17695 [Deltaproteobacteria bacterium]